MHDEHSLRPSEGTAFDKNSRRQRNAAVLKSELSSTAERPMIEPAEAEVQHHASQTTGVHVVLLVHGMNTHAKGIHIIGPTLDVAGFQGRTRRIWGLRGATIFIAVRIRTA